MGRRSPICTRIPVGHGFDEAVEPLFRYRRSRSISRLFGPFAGPRCGATSGSVYDVFSDLACFGFLAFGLDLRRPVAITLARKLATVLHRM